MLKPEEIVKIANYYYKLFLVDYNWSLRFSESRKLIANQIKSISKSIESLSKDLEGNIVLDLEKEKIFMISYKDMEYQLIELVT